MSAEWQARQLLLIASEPGPFGNISPAGRSNLTDFNDNSPSACAQNGAKATPAMRPIGSRARPMVPPQATTTAVCSMTLRMNPPGFQLGVSGCVSPLVLAHRTISTCSPAAGGVKEICHLRKLYLPSSLPSCAGCQSLPPSLEKSTRDTPESPPNAMPRASVGAPARSLSPGFMLVMNDRGTIRLIGTTLKPVSPGLTLACGVSGIV